MTGAEVERIIITDQILLPNLLLPMILASFVVYRISVKHIGATTPFGRVLSCSQLHKYHNYFSRCELHSELAAVIQPILQITSVQFSSVVLSGDNLHTSCCFKLEDDTMHSLIWRKDDKQFYKYGSTLDPPEKEYNDSGMVVDVSKRLFLKKGELNPHASCH